MSTEESIAEWVPDNSYWDEKYLSENLGTTAFLLPDRVSENSESAYYQEDVAGIVKTVKKRGESLEFSFPAERRSYISEHSVVAVATWIGLAIVGGVTYDVAKLAIRTAKMKVRSRLGLNPKEDVSQEPLIVSIAKLRIEDNGVMAAEGIEISGTVAGVEAALNAMISKGGDDEPAEKIEEIGQ